MNPGPGLCLRQNRSLSPHSRRNHSFGFLHISLLTTQVYCSYNYAIVRNYAIERYNEVLLLFRGTVKQGNKTITF